MIEKGFSVCILFNQKFALYQASFFTRKTSQCGHECESVCRVVHLTKNVNSL